LKVFDKFKYLGKYIKYSLYTITNTLKKYYNKIHMYLPPYLYVMYDTVNRAKANTLKANMSFTNQK